MPTHSSCCRKILAGDRMITQLFQQLRRARLHLGLVLLLQLGVGLGRRRIRGVRCLDLGFGEPGFDAGDAGADLRRADVYARVPTPPSPSRIARLLAVPAPWLLPLSSGEALQRTLDALPPASVARLREARVLAASARLADLARDAGFAHIEQATDARPASLLAAALPERTAS